jgi:hypothetical protein
MKLLVTYRSDDKVKKQADMSVPIIQQFAAKWGADTKQLMSDTFPIAGDGKPHYRIFELYQLLETYDRILNIDIDTMIMPRCPNPFDIVHPSFIGVVFEDLGARRNLRAHIKGIQKERGDVGWSTGYINDGFMVVSRCHKEIFNPDNPIWTGWGSDDVHIGYYAHKLKYDIQPLPVFWNYIHRGDDDFNNDRFDVAFVIHYAGSGIFDKDAINRHDQMCKDYAKIYPRPEGYK